MRRIPELKGVLAPVLTPIMADDSLDLEGNRVLAEKLLSSEYVDGLFTVGATSEFMALSYDERMELMKVFAEIPRNGKVMTVNTGCLPDHQVIEMTGLAGELGFDAAAVPVPEHIDTDPASVCRYFKDIAAVGVPFTIYWTPMVKQHKPTLEIVSRLMEYSTFVGMKDSSRDMVEFTSIAAAYGEDISVFQGVEMLHLVSLAVGSAGVVGGGLNLYPGLLAEITRNFEAGNIAEARRLQLQVNQSWDSISVGGGFRSLCKQYWSHKGIISGTRCRAGSNLEMNSSQLEELERLACV